MASPLMRMRQLLRQSPGPLSSLLPPFFPLPSSSAHAEWHSAGSDPSEGGGARETDAAGPLYPTHVRTSGLQKAAIAMGSAFAALAQPERADLVAALGETTGPLAYARMRRRMQVDSEGRRILSERPRVTSAAVAHAWDLPESTFGGAYAAFMGSRNFSADERPAVRFVDDPELAYVAARAREVHDFWHVLFNCPTTVSGELALKLVEWTQTGLPMCGLSVMGGPLRLSARHRARLQQEWYPWALRAGLQAADLSCIYYEEYLGEELEAVRERWRIVPLPTQVKQEG
eukprot:TRINITY_DN2514_c0_g1_i1.p1 TRINITY_DN2514_c0_g1~~TRINITY_DN2514_c0_g1_i1.p1  ORF type:complete len:287 (+),score=45.11 TRINITY_DN2514_c0_g1_i1:398-1258(+)